jgi:ribosomal protein S18 acetylase RimI-like enzyme
MFIQCVTEPASANKMTVTMIELTQTDLHLIYMHGQIEVIDGITVARVPDNPGYRWGNCLLLPHAPTADTLDHYIQRARDLFVDQPQSTHVQLRWDGDAIGDDVKAHAIDRGMQYEHGRAMHATELAHVQIPGINIRPLDIEQEWSDIVALNIACDPEEIDGVPDYIAFKQGLRRAWRAWAATGTTRWWGAFIDDRLVGQAGMVYCPEHRGRYQSVETHPDVRHQGVCPALVSHMGNHAICEGECTQLLLGVNPHGLAIHIYSRLGFELGKWQNGLMLLHRP